jgi:hypothetical protein
MSRDDHVLFCDVTAQALHSNAPSADIENTVHIMLAACVLRALSSNGFTRHNINIVLSHKIQRKARQRDINTDP